MLGHHVGHLVALFHVDGLNPPRQGGYQHRRGLGRGQLHDLLVQMRQVLLYHGDGLHHRHLVHRGHGLVLLHPFAVGHQVFGDLHALGHGDPDPGLLGQSAAAGDGAADVAPGHRSGEDGGIVRRFLLSAAQQHRQQSQSHGHQRDHDPQDPVFSLAFFFHIRLRNQPP